jgi:hypothetical protein
MLFDLGEVRRALILAACGTAVVIGLFALFIEAHPLSDQAGRQGPVVRAGPTELAGARRLTAPAGAESSTVKP